MSTHGTLVKWNEERGFGFVAVGQAGVEVFVHVSAFPRDGVRPQVGELVSFELVPGDGGRQKAIKVQRPGARPARRPAGRGSVASSRWGIASAMVVLMLLTAFGAVFMMVSRREVTELVPVAAQLRAPVSLQPVAAEPRPADDVSAAPAGDFQCDGRTLCSQMTSCPEAEYFLANCPGTQMDGNRDGEPCEQQWCR